MATIEIAPLAGSQAAAGGGMRRDWRLGLTIGAVGLACTPWVAAQSHLLWREAPHYRFIPLVPVAAAALAVRGCRGLGTIVPGSAMVTLGLLVVSWLLSAGADIVFSPAMGAVATLAALAALAHGFGGARLLRAMAPAGLVLALAVRPPLRLDFELTYGLQTLATDLSSRMLDLLGVYHRIAGHVIEVPGRRLFVEEACSGITSLFVVLSLTLCAALWLRRGWVETSVLLATATAWVLLGNVARITAGAYALARRGVDLTGGRLHEAEGLLVLAAVIGLVVSTDRLITLVGVSVGRLRDGFERWLLRRRRERRVMQLAIEGASPDEIEAAMNEQKQTESAKEDRSLGPTRWPEARRTWVGSWPVVAVFGTLAVANLAAAWGGLEYSSPALTRRLAGLGAGDLPEHWGTLRRESYRAERVAAVGALGSYNRQWRYRPDGAPEGTGTTLLAGVDDPYVGWHEVTECYKSRGWVVDSRRVVSRGGEDRVVVRLSRAQAEPGLLVFALDDARGVALRAPSSGGWLSVLDERLAQGWSRLWGAPVTFGRVPVDGPVSSYMVQVLVESEAPLSAEHEQQVLDQFDQFRSGVRRLVRTDGGG